jgi:hypothetical protein
MKGKPKPKPPGNSTHYTGAAESPVQEEEPIYMVQNWEKSPQPYQVELNVPFTNGGGYGSRRVVGSSVCTGIDSSDYFLEADDCV